MILPILGEKLEKVFQTSGSRVLSGKREETDSLTTGVAGDAAWRGYC